MSILVPGFHVAKLLEASLELSRESKTIPDFDRSALGLELDFALLQATAGGRNSVSRKERWEGEQLTRNSAAVYANQMVRICDQAW